MANYAQNIVEVRFLYASSLQKGEEIVSKFSTQFGCDDIYAENCDSENYFSFEACFDWKRSAPVTELQEFCNKERVTTLGVAHEFSI